jgi:hypothetical protein
MDEGYKCSVTGDRCVFMIPNSKACWEMYGEGPDASKQEEYILIEVTIIKANNEEIEETDDFPSHYTDGQINEVLMDRYTEKYGELKEIKWEQI